MEELNKTLQSVRNSAPGYDHIPYAALKILPQDLKQRLLDDVNLQWMMHFVYKDWMEDELIPLPKHNAASEPKDFRPITKSTTCVKLMEKLIATRLTNFLEHRGALNKCQFGARPLEGLPTPYVKLLSAFILRRGRRKWSPISSRTIS